MNQIRSAFAHSILSWHFPGINFYSAGISTSGGIPVNGNMLNFLTKLGIPHAKNVSNGYMEVANSGTQFDLVITAEPYMSSFLEKKSSQEILMDYMDGAVISSFIPKDPIYLQNSPKHFEIELAKTAHSSLRILNKFLNIRSKNPVFVITPKNEDSIDSSLQMAKSLSSDVDGFFVNADFRSILNLDNRFIKERYFISPDKLSEFNYSQLDHHKLFTAKFESQKPESILLSHDWRNFILELGAIRPVVLITAPLESRISQFSDAYFCSVLADFFEIV